MSWDAYLTVTVDGNELGVGDWNYTHNCNKMISIALEEAGYELGEPHWLIGHMGKSWFDKLNGLTASAGAILLSAAIDRMEKDPERFEGMNPSNGWGSYSGVLEVLREMRDKSLQFPSGNWSVSG